MTDPPVSDADPSSSDSSLAAIDLNRTPLAGDPFNLDPPDPTNPNLDGGQVLYHMALGARPEDFHPAVQPLAQGYGLQFQSQPQQSPGLMGSESEVRAAVAPATTTADDQTPDNSDDDSSNDETDDTDVDSDEQGPDDDPSQRTMLEPVVVSAQPVIHRTIAVPLALDSNAHGFNFTPTASGSLLGNLWSNLTSSIQPAENWIDTRWKGLFGGGSHAAQATPALMNQLLHGRFTAADLAGPRAEEASISASRKNTLQLSDADITNLKKALQTEWNPGAGQQQAHGIIDTILNRQASGHWGNTVQSVVDAKDQFSDVNGPISRHARDQIGIGPHDSISDIPNKWIRPSVSNLVDSYLSSRANGTPSSVGANLNYANPNFSDAKNLSWINTLQGPIFGKGNAIHVHGTVESMKKYMPQPYNINLPN